MAPSANVGTVMVARDLPPTRRGYLAHEVVSALQKAIRRSDPDAALYWSFELSRSGFGPWLWKRLRIICSEDIGLAGGPEMPAAIRALNDNWLQDTKSDKNGGLLYVAHAAILLATAPKDRLVDWAAWHHDKDHVERREIPDEALDMHTARGRQLGRHRPHFMEEASKLIPFATSEEEREARLDELEEGYLVEARRFIEAEQDGTLSDLPYNPWDAGTAGTGGANVGTTEPAHNPQLAPSGQLQLDRDEEVR